MKYLRFLKLIGLISMLSLLFNPFINGFYQLCLMIAEDVTETNLLNLKLLFISIVLFVGLFSLIFTKFSLSNTNYLNTFSVFISFTIYVLTAMITNADFAIMIVISYIVYNVVLSLIIKFIKSKNQFKKYIKIGKIFLGVG